MPINPVFSQVCHCQVVLGFHQIWSQANRALQLGYCFLHIGGREYSPEIRVSLGVGRIPPRSEEHTSELQSLTNLVCRLLLEKKKKKKKLKQQNKMYTDT